MENLFLEFIRQYGILGFLLIVLFLLIHDPDRAEKLKVIFLVPFFRFFKWGSKQYLAAKVASTATEFFKRHVTGLIPSALDVKVKIKWVSSASDPVLSQDGTVILRLQETNDQTRNILAATRVVLPHVVCPTLRPNLEYYAQGAIDLAVMRKLSESLGRHTYGIFQRYFFGPELQDKPRTAALFAELIELDHQGVFISIFLHELTILGEALYASGDVSNKTDEVIGLLQYLLTLARRQLGEKIDLEYFSPYFQIGITLVAITEKARKKGLAPYLEAVDVNLRRGCDSIYIIGYSPSFKFVKRLISDLKRDPRLFLLKTNRVSIKSSGLPGVKDAIEIVALRRNPILGDTTFERQVAEFGLEEGSVVEGTVKDVSEKFALVDVAGIVGRIHKTECSWQTVSDCRNVLSKDSRTRFIVKAIDKERDRLALSRRFPEQDPWRSERLPHEGDVIEVDIVAIFGSNYVGRYVDNIEVLIPVDEISWFDVEGPESTETTGTRRRVVIYERSDEKKVLHGSIRRLGGDPWPQIHQRFPKGTRLRGTVLEVSPEFVKIQLPEGLTGIIPRDAMMRGGYEYADFEKSVVKGQGLDVVVSKVFINRQRIRLDLERNVR